jgi:hypothetical protein
MNNGFLSVAGLILLVPIAISVISGGLLPAEAAGRALVLVIVLVAIDRLVLPLGRVLVQFLSIREPESSGDA